MLQLQKNYDLLKHNIGTREKERTGAHQHIMHILHTTRAQSKRCKEVDHCSIKRDGDLGQASIPVYRMTGINEAVWFASKAMPESAQAAVC